MGHGDKLCTYVQTYRLILSVIGTRRTTNQLSHNNFIAVAVVVHSTDLRKNEVFVADTLSREQRIDNIAVCQRVFVICTIVYSTDVRTVIRNTYAQFCTHIYVRCEQNIPHFSWTFLGKERETQARRRLSLCSLSLRAAASSSWVFLRPPLPPLSGVCLCCCPLASASPCSLLRVLLSAREKMMQRYKKFVVSKAATST